MNKKTFRSIVWLIVIAALALLAVSKVDTLLAFIKTLFIVLAPLFVGVVIAYILNKPYKSITNLFEGIQASKGLEQRGIKPFALLITYILLFSVVAVVVSVLIPQLFVSAQALFNNAGDYAANIESAIQWATGKLHMSGIPQSEIADQLTKLYQTVKTMLSGLVPAIMGFTQSMVHTVTNVAVGIVISFYLLIDKHHLADQAKGVLYAYLPKETADQIAAIGNLANDVFSKFVSGQLLEATILGTLCCIGMLIFQFPYAVLISVIIGITNMIPIVGPIFGTIPGVLILLMISPTTAFWFLVFIIVLQQFESNIIYPKVVGTSVGLPAIWVLLAVFVGGGLFGLLGMLFAVPAFSVLYKLVKTDALKRLEQKDGAQQSADLGKQ